MRVDGHVPIRAVRERPVEACAVPPANATVAIPEAVAACGADVVAPVAGVPHVTVPDASAPEELYTRAYTVETPDCATVVASGCATTAWAVGGRRTTSSRYAVPSETRIVKDGVAFAVADASNCHVT